ncbi:hypothetical protein B0T17DRAFT_490602 [Bombardia bombarda]|uniref:Uncharacterized protein n=1 Tax=Bombardia bombarda TaxID=252184 RepID=A0AA40C8R5_9PEZI|nr:hypothetical protein B0T17DRAFT_490602 [Bombardia bombarda]
MSIEDKPAVLQAENVKEKPRRRGCAGHCLKFWWVYLIALLVIIVIVVPIILLVAVPKLAQSKLDEAELTVDSIVMTNSQSNNFTMAINSTIRSDGKVHAKIEPFTGKMYIEDIPSHHPFAFINFPETTSDAFQVVNVSQFTPIDDREAFTTFNTWLLQNDTFDVTIEGDTFVRVKGIARRYPVTFKKTVTLPGLRNFEGTTVFDTSISLETNRTKVPNNFLGKTRIPNRSIVTFEIGNTTFYNYLLGQDIGEVFIDNLILKPGNDNVFDMRATIEQGPIVTALGKKPYCDETKGVLPVQLRGKNVTNNGQYLSYFADALASANQTIELDVGGTLKKSLNITIPCSKDQ